MHSRMSSQPAAALASLLRHPPFLLFNFSRGFSEFSYQIATVAVGWQIYDLTGSAFYPGLGGLVQFIPGALRAFGAGHAGDPFDRKRGRRPRPLPGATSAAFLASGRRTRRP